MADETNEKEVERGRSIAPPPPPAPRRPETQQQRWIKYGANVVLVTVVVILLAGILTYLAQRVGKRIDTTAAGAYSLKPQTTNILRDLKGKTKIVSLYTKEIIEGGKSVPSPYAGPVIDLLDEYRRKGKNIEVDAIDPVQNPTKVDALITEVTNKYGGEIKQYKEVLDAYPKTAEQIKAMATAETAKVEPLRSQLEALEKGDEDAQTTYVAIVTVRGLVKELDRTQQLIDRRVAQKPPDYRGAVNSVEDSLDLISRTAARIVEIFNKAKADEKLAPPVREYITGAVPTYEKMKKLADDQLAATKKLGDLKLDDLRQSLRARDAILVMGETDMRVIPFEQVWKADDEQVRNFVQNQGQEIKPRFAGEQQISTAILALSQAKKPKVVFVRAGGPPLAQPGMGPFQRGGPMSQVADRLRQYNFEVLEKDLSGMWAMQAQMQQMPAAPEPSDEQIKDAVWIALAFPTGQQNPMMPSPSIGPKVAEHLKGGGSAMVLFAPQVDAMADTMKEWGIDVRTDAVAVHEPIKLGEGRQGDAIEEALKYPFVFDIRDYGDHMITRPLQSLPGFFVPLLTVKKATTQPSGVKTTTILPLPTEPKSWGETNLEGLSAGNNEAAQFDEKTDVAGPIFGGAVAEKDGGGGRLVVIASPMFAFDRYLNEPDPNLLRRGVIVSRFPANAELFNNAVFWLSKMEPMIAISPAAMEVSRIEPIKPVALRVWREGLLMIGLPMAVILAGALVWFARRD
jgi:hypothetical protein